MCTFKFSAEPKRCMNVTAPQCVLRTKLGRLAAMWSMCAHAGTVCVIGEELACGQCRSSWDPAGPHAVRVIEQNDLIFAYFHPLGHAPTWDVPPFFEATGWSKSTFDARDYREIAYWYGDNRCRATWTRGKACYPSNLGLT